jgi:RimJ/RimL family protein N-acetyltransferase
MDSVNHKPEILAYLSQNTLKHIVHLKMLSAYSQDIESHYFTDGSATGVLFLLPTIVTTYDALTYPETQYVVLIAADAPSITGQMLDYIPTTCNLIFKFIDPQDRAVIEDRYPLKRVTSFLSYTGSGQARFCHSKQVLISEQVDEKLLPIYRQSGYKAEAIKGYVKSGRAISFALYENKKPVSVCLAYQNYGQIWEIGMLYTVNQARRKGYARQIVETALSTLLANGYIPRYQMDEANLASKELAERVGLHKFLTTEHYLMSHENLTGRLLLI